LFVLQVRNEIAVLKKVSMGHRNILTLVDYFETMNNCKMLSRAGAVCQNLTPNVVYLVTDLALGGELFDRICRKGSYFESDAADLVRATLSAVSYLHDHGIVHRDLKPENLLFRTPEDNADLLIADFGLSRIMDEEQFHVLTTTCGTPGYMAPEIFKKTGHGKPVDIWAIGVITYFLLCGYTPFDRESNLEEMQAILVADYSFTPVDYWRGVSDNARQFIRRCLTVDPQERQTAHEALSHPWIREDATEQREPSGVDLLPTVRKNFNARVKLHAAIDTIRAINQLRAGQSAAMMNGARSREPAKTGPGGPAQAGASAGKTADMDAEGVEGTGQLGQGHDEEKPLDPRGNARGQTEAQIREQERRIRETQQGLWGKR
jgi:calcium/calmodulin-dependent protein kinase I